MSRVMIDIESILLEGTGMDPAKGRRLASLTQAALERLLRDRGASTSLATRGDWSAGTKSVRMGAPAGDSESRWAEELAAAVYRSIDRST